MARIKIKDLPKGKSICKEKLIWFRGGHLVTKPLQLNRGYTGLEYEAEKTVAVDFR